MVFCYCYSFNMVEEDGVAIVDIAMRMSAVIILTMVLIVAQFYFLSICVIAAAASIICIYAEFMVLLPRY